MVISTIFQKVFEHDVYYGRNFYLSMCCYAGHVCHQDLFCGDKPKGVLVGDAWRYQSQTRGTVM